MPPRRKQGAPRSELQEWYAEFVKREWHNERNRKANLSLIKAVVIFVGAVVTFRTVGDSIFQT